VLSVLASLIMLLVNPNPDSANNGTARDVLRQDPEEYKRRVRECARRTG
jgi:ubiquitin-protein ligase